MKKAICSVAVLIGTMGWGVLVEAENRGLFTIDMPYVPAQETPVVLAQAAPAAGTTPPPDFLFNVCKETESSGDPSSAFRTVDPAGMLEVFLQAKEGRRIESSAVRNIAMLQNATHGKITSVIDNTGRPWYAYDAEPNYTGDDQAVFLAEFEGKVYKVIVKLVVTPTVGESPLDEGEEPVCPPPQLIKVNGKPVPGSTSNDLNSIPVTFADLTGGVDGQTTATGITLDTNAVGHNRLVDTALAINKS